MIDGKTVFDQPVKTDLRKYDNIRKIATGQGMTIQQVVYWTILVSKNIMWWQQLI